MLCLLGGLAIDGAGATTKEAPAVFERIVIAPLVKMDYGGSRAAAAEAIGK
jgi:restriction endonuclease Mrr